VTDELVADDRAGAGDEVEDAGRQVGLGDALGEQARAHGRARRRRPHDRVAARQRGSDDLRRHRVRPVPRRDHRDRAQRAADEEDAVAGERARHDRALQANAVLGGAAPHRDELVDLVVGLGVQRLALVERERERELVAAALAHGGDAAQVVGARKRGLALPRRERGLRGGDGAAGVLAVAFCDRPERLARRGARRLGDGARQRVLPGARDEHPGRGGHGEHPMRWRRVGAMERYDFVIVGGGSAGCALANRLSADPSTKVLVLEAGRPDWKWDLFIHMPAALTYPIGSRFYDWKYESEPEPFMNGRRVYHARGKVLGGSSSINGMIFQRGNPMDYERWAGDDGMETWDYAHCLPYFKKMETCLAGADEWRGGSGPLVLERGPATSPLFRAFFQACQEAGYPLTKDVNGYQQEGFAPFDRNIHNGRRYSAARAYLHPVTKRENLEVRCRAFVDRVVFEGTRAVGVEIGGETIHAGEVILCGGA